MVAIKNAVRLRKIFKTTSAALATVYLDKEVEVARVICYQQISWEIDKATSGGNTRARLFIERGGYNHYIEEQQSPAADNLYTYSDPLYVYEGEKLGLEVDQAQSATTIQLNGAGYYQNIKDSAQEV